ncbi:uncharacterized protein LOC142231301 [Haematobia irritans]|uniref:uncharacterized protein LOC142231301 n=1 Tax=Haematobia irritans TaxID=7368 RepID=UPI003F5011B6
MNFLFNINVCRVCMKNEHTSDLYGNKDLLEKFTYTTRLTVLECDNLPKVICSKCIIRLKVAHSFIETAHESEKNLKAFLTRISNEFQEVTQSGKSTKITNTSCVVNSEQDLTEDEMLTLIGEGELDKRDDTLKKDSNANDKCLEKRKASPIKVSPCKVFKEDTNNDLKDSYSNRSTLVFNTVENKSRKSIPLHSTYVRDEEILFVHSENDAIKFESVVNLCEDEEILSEEVRRQNLGDDDDDDHHHFEDHEHAEDDDGIHDTLDDQGQEFAEVQNVSDDTIKEQSIFKTHPTDELTNNEAVSQGSPAELNELGLQSDVLQPSLVNNDIGNIVSEETDTYLSQYESMLSNQVNDLRVQYIPNDYIDENSLEENVLKTSDIIEIHEEMSDVNDEEDGGIDKYDEEVYDVKSKAEQEKILPKPSSVSLKEASQKHNRFYCHQCDRDFSTKTNLNRHMQSHNGSKPHVCPECSKSFSQKATLKQHMYTHSGEKPYVCDVCNRGFTQCKSLIFHMRRHTGEKPFQCEYCLIWFRQKDALRIHILKYHVIAEITHDGKESYICIICQKKFNAKEDFKIHMKIHTTTTEKQTNESVADQRMFHSIATTSGSHGYDSHEQERFDAAVVNVSASSASEPQRAKKFQCRKCFKCFALKKSLIRHMSIHYENVEDEITECSDCDMQFSSSMEYQDHLSEFHQFACATCPQLVFKTIQDFKVHMMDHDSNHYHRRCAWDFQIQEHLELPTLQAVCTRQKWEKSPLVDIVFNTCFTTVKVTYTLFVYMKLVFVLWIFIKMPRLLELCRICGNDKNLVNVFKKGPEMLDKLRICANIDIKPDDVLPKVICEQCDERLDMSYMLRKQSELMQKRFQNELQKQGNDIQCVPDKEQLRKESNIQDSAIINGIEQPEEIDLLDTHSESTLVASETEERDDFEMDYEYHIPSTTIVDTHTSSRSNYDMPRAPTIDDVDDIESSESFSATAEMQKRITREEDKNVMVEMEDNEESVEVGGQIDDSFVPSDCSSNLLQPQDILQIDMKLDDGSHKRRAIDDDTEYFPNCRKKPYNCVTCNAFFPKKRDYQQHLLQHGHKHFQCEQCLQIFPTRYRLVRHEKTHNNESVVVGDNNEDNFVPSDSSSNLLQPQNFLKIDMKSDVGSHKRRPIDDDTEYFPNCRKKPYHCVTCNEFFPKKKDYQEHIVQHGPKRYKCVQCLETFPTRYRMVQHEKTHSNGQDYKCSQCNRQFRKLHHLRKHFKDCHSEPTKTECNICHQSFSRPDSLTRHQKSAHCGDQSKANNNNNKKWYCKQCSKSFRSQQILDEHKAQQACTNPIVVRYGRPRFEIPPEYIALSPDNRYKCYFCKMMFKSISNYKTHLLIHENIKPFPCSQCPKSFRTRYALSNHELIHNNEKPFACDICGQSFRQVIHLKHHLMNKHSFNKPIKCSICSEGFVTKWRLRDHLRREHYHTIKAFKCAECPEEFALKYDLKRHARTVHLRAVDIVDSDNEGGIQTATFIPDVISESSNVDNNTKNMENENHYIGIASMYENEVEETTEANKLPEVVNMPEETAHLPITEDYDDDVQIVEDVNLENDISHIANEFAETPGDQSNQFSADSSPSHVYLFYDIESPSSTPLQSNSTTADTTSLPTVTEYVIDCIELDSSKSSMGSPIPETQNNSYFDIEEEDEIHITEERIQTYTTSSSFCSAKNITSS